jgi:glycosyltransferase involved in cell wall biosynthesis
MSRVIFYAPMKRIDASAASGVQRFPSLIVSALKRAGHDVVLPELPATYCHEPDLLRQYELTSTVKAAIDPLLHALTSSPPLRAWVTYHNYYKSPDVIGPEICNHLNIPYLIIEGSHAPKRAIGPWAEYHALSVKALAAADALLAVTDRDVQCLATVPGARGRVVPFPPFIDADALLIPSKLKPGWPIRILSAGSMADSRKTESYRRLFDALAPIAGPHLQLSIAGDGPNRRLIESFAAPAITKGMRIVFHGRIPPEAMPAFLAEGDIFAWPGIGEAFGLIYLEAQAAGLPIAAEHSLGVHTVISQFVHANGPNCDANLGFAGMLLSLIADPRHRLSMGKMAQNWVRNERSIDAAARRLTAILGGPRP